MALTRGFHYILAHISESRNFSARRYILRDLICWKTLNETKPENMALGITNCIDKTYQ